MDTPLSGLKVLELSCGVSGAYAGRLLAALGATVVRTGRIDDVATSPEALPVVTAWLNEGKSELADPTKQVAAEAAVADLVIVEEPGSGPLNELIEIAMSAVAQETTRIPVVRVAASFNGREAAPGTALTSSAWGAISWVLGEPEDRPLSLPFNIPDYQTGVHGAAAGLLMLIARTDARAIDVAGRDLMAHYAGINAANYLPYDRPWHRSGARPFGSAGVYPAGTMPCRDGWVGVMIRNQGEWERLKAAMGHPSWTQDPRFADARVIARLHVEEADTYFLPWLASKTEAELSALAEAFGVAIAPLRRLPAALEEPQWSVRKFLDPVGRGDDQPSVLLPNTPWILTGGPEVTPKDEGRRWPLNGPPEPPFAMLSGLRILDLSWVWSGPMVTSILADVGADVIKIEHCGRLDTARQRGRARRDGVEVEGPEIEATPYFNQMNHGKRSVTIDLKSEAGRRLVLDLAAHCDVVVENMRPGALQNLGLRYVDFVEANPSIVMLSMSMAGQEGPLRTLKGYAGIMTAISGFDAIVGYPDGAVIGTQTTAFGDPNAAGHALAALMALLYQRRETGRGGWIDLSQTEASLCVMAGPIVQSQLEGSIVAPGNDHPLFSPHGVFKCQGNDSWIAIAIRSDEEWGHLVEVLGGLAPAEWGTTSARLSERSSVSAWVEDRTSISRRDDLVQRLAENGVAVAPVASYEELMVADWKVDRKLSLSVDHKYLGAADVFVVPWKFDGQSVGIAEPAPILGADTEQVLTEILGRTPADITSLEQAGILR